MNHGKLTFLILQLNTLLDAGKYDGITVSEVEKRIDDGSVLQFLKERAGSDIDLSPLLDREASGDFESFYVKQLQSLYDAFAGYGKRKWGVEKKGLCLLLAWTNEIVQQGTGWVPNEDISTRD